ncbi:MAG: Nramp family divalent metal transporter [Phycisphaeraceae bacterium]|nr:Nramp family divalent metal transporter [Phycisphaeraceae bacterium]
MSNPIGPREMAVMPQRTAAFWRMTGPGAVLVGLSIGAGEIIVWPRIAAQFGSTMLWAAALGVFMQFWINLEVGRWTVATGETPYLGFARLWRPWAMLFILFNFFGWFFPGWARASGAALKALCLGPEHPSPEWLWTGITFAGVLAVLFGPKRVYAAVEKVIGALVILITVGLIYIALRVGTWDLVKQVFAGLANVGHVETSEGFTGKDQFIAIVFAGAGGTANLFYGFYLRDKRIGMGGRMPSLLNPFRQRQETRGGAGFTFADDDVNRGRFRDWMRFVWLDQTLYFWLLNTFTMFLFIFGSLAVLHPAGIVPQSATLIWDEAKMLADTLGPSGRVLFLVIGVATLFSTQVTLVDGVSRSLADLCHNSFRAAQRYSEAQWYVGWALCMIGFGFVITWLLGVLQVSVLGFLFNAAYVGGFAMAVYTPLLLYLNLRHLPRSARPRLPQVLIVSVIALVYVGFAVYCLLWELGLIGG